MVHVLFGIAFGVPLLAIVAMLARAWQLARHVPINPGDREAEEVSR